MEKDKELLKKKLIDRVNEVSKGKHNEIEKFCWMVVHEHIHGVMPTEYDIREIDEELFLDILSKVKK